MGDGRGTRAVAGQATVHAVVLGARLGDDEEVAFSFQPVVLRDGLGVPRGQE